MYLTEYVKNERKRKENISFHLRSLCDLLKEVVEEIECIEAFMCDEDDDYDDEYNE